MRSLLIILVLTGSCFADNCFHRNRQTVVIHNPVSYFVGESVRAEAIIRRELRKDPEYQEFLKFKQWRAAAAQKGSAPQKQQQVAKAKGLLTTLCAQCHGKTVAAGGFSFDGTNKISAEKFQTIVSWLSDKVKPPGQQMQGVMKKLIDEKKTAQLLSELIDLQTQPGKKEDQ